MKKKIYSYIALLLITFSLYGCGKDYIPDLSDDELKQCEEYIVKLLLKYDKNHSGAMLSEDEQKKQEEKITNQARLQAEVKANKEAAMANKQQEENNNKENEGGETSAAEQVYSDIDEFLGLAGIDINYAGMNITDSYPTELAENDFQGVVHATKNNKLVVLNFAITNNSGSDYYLDLAGMGIKAAFKINGSKTKVPLTTMLMDDFFNFRDTIIAGDTVNLVLLVELSEADAESIASMTMIMKANGGKAETTIL